MRAAQGQLSVRNQSVVRVCRACWPYLHLTSMLLELQTVLCLCQCQLPELVHSAQKRRPSTPLSTPLHACC